MQYYIIKTQAGQSLRDVVLQEYGTSDIAVLNMLVIDNADVLVYGITTVPAAGLELKIRSNTTFRNTNVNNRLDGVNQQTDDESNSGELPEQTGSGEILEGSDIKFIVGQFPLHRAVFLNVWWQEDNNWFFGTIRIIHNNLEPRLSEEYTSWDDFMSKLQFATYFDADNIILKIINNESNMVYFYYDIVTPRF